MNMEMKVNDLVLVYETNNLVYVQYGDCAYNTLETAKVIVGTG